MQWNQMADTGGYKEFRMASQYVLFHKAYLIDKRSVGMFFTKGRRTGFTEMAIDHNKIIDHKTKSKKHRNYIKTYTDATVVFRRYLCYSKFHRSFQPAVKEKLTM
jgi:hypothetical protein